MLSRPSSLLLRAARSRAASSIAVEFGTDDCNPMGLVHGGSVLQLMERAGIAAAGEHLRGSEAQVPVLARFEQTRFRMPVRVGEEVVARAHVGFTSDRSMLVEVDVTTSGKPSHKALLWYCGVKLAADGGAFEPVAVPQLAAGDGTSAGRALYERRVADRDVEHWAEGAPRLVPGPAAPGSAQAAATTLAQLMLPSDAFECSGFIPGGTVAKLMDNAAAISANRFARNMAVTASLDAVDFYSPVHVGDVLTVEARPTYVTQRSAEIFVRVMSESLAQAAPDLVTHEAYFTFMAVDAAGKVLEMPKLQLETEGDKLRFQEGARRAVRRRRDRPSS